MDDNKSEINAVKPKLWSKPFILTLIAVAAASICMTLFMPLLPIYIKMIGGNSSLAGIVVSTFTIAALVGRPFFAYLIDWKGRKPVIISGFILILIGCFSYQFVTVIGVLLVLRVIHGIGYGASTNAASTIAADVLPNERRSQGIGYYGFIMSAALALGPATGLLIMKRFDIKTSFTVAAVIAVIGLGASSLISYEKKTHIPGKQSAKPADFKSKLSSSYEKTALPASLVMIFIAIAYSGVVTYLATYTGTLGLNNVSIWFFLIYAASLLVTRITVDRVTKKRELSVVLLPGIVLMAVAFILLGTGRTLISFLIAAVFFGIGYGAVQPTLIAIVMSLCAPSKRGAANSTFFSAMDLGIGLGSLIWGFVSDAIGYASIYFCCIVCMVLAAAVLMMIKKKQKGTVRPF